MRFIQQFVANRLTRLFEHMVRYPAWAAQFWYPLAASLVLLLAWYSRVCVQLATLSIQTCRQTGLKQVLRPSITVLPCQMQTERHQLILEWLNMR